MHNTLKGTGNLLKFSFETEKQIVVDNLASFQTLIGNLN